MPQSHQKATLAMLLTAPSALHKAWREDNTADLKAELDRLPFSAAARAAAIEALPKLKPNIDSFNVVASRMGAELWAGGEPHPPNEEAFNLVDASRRLDGE